MNKRFGYVRVSASVPEIKVANVEFNVKEIINEIDKKMIVLFEERMAAVLDVLKYKKEHNLPVFDESREIELIKNGLMLII